MLRLGFNFGELWIGYGLVLAVGFGLRVKARVCTRVKVRIWVRVWPGFKVLG